MQSRPQGVQRHWQRRHREVRGNKVDEVRKEHDEQQRERGMIHVSRWQAAPAKHVINVEAGFASRPHNKTPPEDDEHQQHWWTHCGISPQQPREQRLYGRVLELSVVEEDQQSEQHQRQRHKQWRKAG